MWGMAGKQHQAASGQPPNFTGFPDSNSFYAWNLPFSPDWLLEAVNVVIIIPSSLPFSHLYVVLCSPIFVSRFVRFPVISEIFSTFTLYMIQEEVSPVGVDGALKRLLIMHQIFTTRQAFAPCRVWNSKISNRPQGPGPEDIACLQAMQRQLSFKVRLQDG